MKRDEYLRRQEAKKRARAQEPIELRGLAAIETVSSNSELRAAAAALIRHAVILQAALLRSVGYRRNKVTK